MSESGYYPAGADFDSDAPWNEKTPKGLQITVTCVQSLSKSDIPCITDDYIPGDTEIGYEEEIDEEGFHHYYPVASQDSPDFSDTNLLGAYSDSYHLTILELLNAMSNALLDYKKTLRNEADRNKNLKDASKLRARMRKIDHLISEASGWVEDDLEIIMDEYDGLIHNGYLARNPGIHGTPKILRMHILHGNRGTSLSRLYVHGSRGFIQ